ncbi:MAG: hypothetical protein JWL80_321 [Parcubacteria group bacterium]|nr:hypothetical protein [Parcubacteria group bacterium]
MAQDHGAFRRCILLILLEAFYQADDSVFSFERFFKAVQGLRGYLHHNKSMSVILGLTTREDVISHLHGLAADNLILFVDNDETDREIRLPREVWRQMASGNHHKDIRMSDGSRLNFFRLSQKAALYSKNLLPHERCADQ